MQEHKKRVFVCQKLQRLGYAPQQRMKLYGEEFDLISNPMPDKVGYFIVGVCRKSGGSRHIRIPISVVHTIEHELSAMEDEVFAA